MTLKESVESGKPFKRKCWEQWYTVNEFGEIQTIDFPYHRIFADVNTIFADDL